MLLAMLMAMLVVMLDESLVHNHGLGCCTTTAQLLVDEDEVQACA